MSFSNTVFSHIVSIHFSNLESVDNSNTSNLKFLLLKLFKGNYMRKYDTRFSFENNLLQTFCIFSTFFKTYFCIEFYRTIESKKFDILNKLKIIC